MDKQSTSPGVRIFTIEDNQVGQRIDNFLAARLKGVPKSRIYRIIRKGEVRVNKKRVKPEYKLALDDAVRVPPVRVAVREEAAAPSAGLRDAMAGALLHEDDDLLILNKPSGLPVHGGTGVKIGLIEALRRIRPDLDYLELVHRLDKGTSGCLLVAKNARTLKALGEQFRSGGVEKRYHAIVSGRWPAHVRQVDAALQRQEARGGERMVEVSVEGKAASTAFRILRELDGHTLVEAGPRTGRTHQIRVHAQLAGHPIAGDEKYNQEEANRALRRRGVSRLCLHAASLRLRHPAGGELRIEAPYDEGFEQALKVLESS